MPFQCAIQLYIITIIGRQEIRTHKKHHYISFLQRLVNFAPPIVPRRNTTVVPNIEQPCAV